MSCDKSGADVSDTSRSVWVAVCLGKSTADNLCALTNKDKSTHDFTAYNAGYFATNMGLPD
jgi:hypothetical protein